MFGFGRFVPRWAMRLVLVECLAWIGSVLFGQDHSIWKICILVVINSSKWQLCSIIIKQYLWTDPRIVTTWIEVYSFPRDVIIQPYPNTTTPQTHVVWVRLIFTKPNQKLINHISGTKTWSWAVLLIMFKLSKFLFLRVNVVPRFGSV